MPASPYQVMAGSVISASLITGINSDLPGIVVAQVTENVDDTVTGSALLIPQGSRLIGTYDSVVAFGQSRALLVWQRIVMPDGSSMLYRATYGESETVAELIPFMLEAFLDSDRAFAKARKRGCRR